MFGLEEILPILLGDCTTEGGFTNDWRRVEETITLLTKQRRVSSKGVGSKIDVEPNQTPKASKKPFDSTPPVTPRSTFRATKPNEGRTLEDLIKGFRELRVEFNDIKKVNMASFSQSLEEARKYP